MKSRFSVVYANHLFLALKRNDLLRSFLIKKLFGVIGTAVFVYSSCFVLEILLVDEVWKLAEIKKNFLFITTFFLAISSSFSQSVLNRDMKEYLILPFSLNCVACVLLFLSFFGFRNFIYYIGILTVGLFIELNILRLLIYLLLLTAFFNLILLRFKKKELIIISSLLVGYLLFRVTSKSIMESFLVFGTMSFGVLLLIAVLFREIRKKYNFK